MILWIWRQVFWCRRIFLRSIQNKPKIVHYKLPWLWIGVVVDGKVTTVTEVINYSIDFGELVTDHSLAKITGIQNADRWLYLDSKTLEERVFPSSGFVIEDDSGVFESESNSE